MTEKPKHKPIPQRIAEYMEHVYELAVQAGINRENLPIEFTADELWQRMKESGDDIHKATFSTTLNTLKRDGIIMPTGKRNIPHAPGSVGGASFVYTYALTSVLDSVTAMGESNEQEKESKSENEGVDSAPQNPETGKTETPEDSIVAHPEGGINHSEDNGGGDHCVHDVDVPSGTHSIALGNTAHDNGVNIPQQNQEPLGMAPHISRAERKRLARANRKQPNGMSNAYLPEALGMNAVNSQLVQAFARQLDEFAKTFNIFLKDVRERDADTMEIMTKTHTGMVQIFDILNEGKFRLEIDLPALANEVAARMNDALEIEHKHDDNCVPIREHYEKLEEVRKETIAMVRDLLR